jgi:transaldolase/glucose-6-phosphate isomerase
MTKLHDLNALGQSIWYDNIQRSLLDDGGLQELIDAGIVGVTSNPSIFQKAIADSTDYDQALTALALDGKGTIQIYEALALEDIQNAADLLNPVYEDTDGRDGYISLEVSPTLAHDTAGTIAEARRLHAAVSRPNVMIKVPATQEGVPAIRTLIGEGININVTLLFSNNNYEQVARAYIEGLQEYGRSGADLQHVASVASFFVSRVDGLVDKALAATGSEDLQGKIAIANAKVAYTIYEELFSGEEWQALAARGARPQRLLWASTSTKNPAYPDVLYMNELIGPETVNTAPPATVDAFLDHGTVAVTLTVNVEEARAQLAELAELGIDLDEITAGLQVDGVKSFADAFAGMMESIDQKRRAALAKQMNIETSLGSYATAVAAALQDLAAQDTIGRIWRKDHTVWKPDPKEIANRLDWLTIAAEMEHNLGALADLAADIRAAGYEDVVLLGMGGSSLAPEVFSRTFGTAQGYPRLHILDSTDPGAVLAIAHAVDLRKTLFIVATKSGGTAETISFFKVFYNRLVDQVGPAEAGPHFVAITDPGSSLADVAERYNFRATFLNNPNIGGRYSALSYFGLLAAALIGVDVAQLLDRAQIAALNGGQDGVQSDAPNVAATLGVIISELAKVGRDKLTFIISPPLESFGDWVEQLIAESTGKEGKGILPVVGEPVGVPEDYGADRLFVYLRLAGDDTFDSAVQALRAAGQPVLQLDLHDLYDLGAQMFLWELATAVAGARLGIQPFDQPNVEEAKIQARQMINAYQETGALPEGETAVATKANLLAFLDQAKPGDYVALQAYVQPTLETDEALQVLRSRLRDLTGLAVTVGYGPRFLHSTGQLHKGDGGNGLFIQFTAAMPEDVAIPDTAGEEASGMTFGVLKTAQALGDAAALREAGRRIVHFHLDQDVPAGIASLLA